MKAFRFYVSNPDAPKNTQPTSLAAGLFSLGCLLTLLLTIPILLMLLLL